MIPEVLVENMDSQISAIPHSNSFANINPRERETKEKINKWDYIKLKSFCMAKKNNIKVNREPTVWENIFASDTSDKDLFSKIYKGLT